MAPAKKITLEIVLQHVQAMEQRLAGRFDKVDGRFDTLERNLKQVEHNLTRQIDGIDKRLDELEIVELPARVARIERHLELPVK